jgi:cyclopropane-fatty-acyl-phospholipid synthase
MSKLEPFFDNIQSHYDLSDDFFALFLDPSRTYSCAYFQKPNMTLAEAQTAKIDLSLDKCDLKPGMRLLDVGCGWGSTARRAAQKYGVHVIGLTLSRNQHQYAREQARDLPPASGRTEIRLAGWEEFDERVDRIVSIGAFEHFRRERYDNFFRSALDILPGDGRMLLHTIVSRSWSKLESAGIDVTHEDVLFAKFIGREIFPGGQLVTAEVVQQHATAAGFRVAETQSLQPHYARTLECWAEKLQSQRERAVQLASVEVFDRYMRYLTGCAQRFASGHIDVMQFTLCAGA